MYEIDTNIKLLDKIQKNSVIYGYFIQQQFTKKYKTIVGNPPYVKTKKVILLCLNQKRKLISKV